MKKENERLWLKLNKVKREIQHIKYHYAGTKDKDIIEDMITYIKVLMEKLEKDE